MSGRHLALVLDVESAGLHGEGFAYGTVLVDLGSGETLAEDIQACPLTHVSGTAGGFDWLRDNLPQLPITCCDPAELRAKFWSEWLHYKAKDVALWADCGWPVEANFLSACIRQFGSFAERKGPYPLQDVATAAWAAGLPTHFPRLERELPEHNPRNDARHSARKLLAAYARRRPE